MAGQLLGVSAGDAAGDDWPGNIAGTAEGSLRRHEDVGHVLETQRSLITSCKSGAHLTYLLFAQKRKMKKDLQRLSVRGEDDDLSDTTVESFRCFLGITVSGEKIQTFRDHTFVGTLLQLLVLVSLLDQIQDLDGQQSQKKVIKSCHYTLRTELAKAGSSARGQAFDFESAIIDLLNPAGTSAE